MKQSNVDTSSKQPIKYDAASHPAMVSTDTATGSNPSPAPLAADERIRLIAEAAYYRAEARGFTSGGEVEDWLQAETEVNKSILS